MTHSVASICDALGRRALAQRLGVGLTAISNAVTDGRFPAKWFAVVDAMCREHGLTAPTSLFNFVGIDASPLAAPADIDRKG